MKFLLLIIALSLFRAGITHSQDIDWTCSGNGIVIIAIQFDRMKCRNFRKQVQALDLNTPGNNLVKIKIDEEVFYDDGLINDSVSHDGIFTSRNIYMMLLENRNTVPLLRCWMLGKHFMFDQKLFSISAQEGEPPCIVRCDFYCREGMLEINYSAFGQGVSW
jgi:hypothetical protein